MRVVIDANVYASALINNQGTPALILKYTANTQTCTLIISPSIIQEISRVLFYPKIRQRIKLPDEEIELWIESLQIISHIIVPRFTYPILIQEDPADDQYLIAALEGRADYIISGDQHLLNLKEYRSIKIVTPADFLFYNQALDLQQHKLDDKLKSGSQ